MRSPAFPKSSPELVARYDAVLSSHPETERRTMFGYPSSFVAGNMATGLCREDWYVRLPADGRAELLSLPGAGPFEPMPGRPMREYVVLPPAVVVDDAALEGWLRRAIDYAGNLPPKVSGRRKASRAG